jgi:tetratricopeptide (TPR) repeat protein
MQRPLCQPNVRWLDGHFMRKMQLLWAALLAIGLVLSTVYASTLSDAQKRFEQGDFLVAANLAASSNSSDGLVLATRALTWYTGERPEREQFALYGRCIEYARRAVALDENNPDAYFELGAAIGRQGRLKGAASSFFEGIATQVQQNFEQALKIDPKHTSALIGLGLWHAQVVAQGGGWLYGGSNSAALRYLEASFALEPNNIGLRNEFVRGLLMIDKDKYRERGRKILLGSLNIPTGTEPERRMLATTRQMLRDLGESQP